MVTEGNDGFEFGFLEPIPASLADSLAVGTLVPTDAGVLRGPGSLEFSLEDVCSVALHDCPTLLIPRDFLVTEIVRPRKLVSLIHDLADRAFETGPSTILRPSKDHPADRFDFGELLETVLFVSRLVRVERGFPREVSRKALGRVL